jgi:hypothetical protein
MDDAYRRMEVKVGTSLVTERTEWRLQFEATRARGELPSELQQRIADEQATLDEVGMWTSDSKATLEPVAQRIATLAEEYTGYTDQDDVAYVHTLADELAARPGVEAVAVYEPETNEDDVETIASIDFTLAGIEYRLAQTNGWEVRIHDRTYAPFDMRGAFASSVHPAAVVDEALAAIDTHLKDGA